MGALQLARSIVAQEGALALYSGLSPAIARHVVYTSTRITAYEQLRARWRRRQRQQKLGQPQGQEPAASPGVAAKLAMGLAAGAVGQLVAVPADLVKVGAPSPR